MGGQNSKNPAGGNQVALESPAADKASTSNSSTPVRPKSLSPSKSPSPNRPEMAAIQIPETSSSKDLPLPEDPRSPTNEMSRTPLLDATPFTDPRSPDNNILRTPLDKTSGFKGFQLDESLPYIDESQEAAKPPSSPPHLSLSPLNLDASVEEDGSGGVDIDEGTPSSRIDTPDDLSLDLSSGTPPEIFRQSTGTPPDGFIDAVKEFDDAIGEELERDGSFEKEARSDTLIAGNDIAEVTGSNHEVAGNDLAEVADKGAEILAENDAGVKVTVSDDVASANYHLILENELSAHHEMHFTPHLSMASLSGLESDSLYTSRQSSSAIITSHGSKSTRTIEI